MKQAKSLEPNPKPYVARPGDIWPKLKSEKHSVDCMTAQHPSNQLRHLAFVLEGAIGNVPLQLGRPGRHTHIDSLAALYLKSGF
jgi:hypothetical protein